MTAFGMEFYLAKERLAYDGSQLASHFALKQFGVKGDSLVAFTGSMEIAPQRMADLEDVLDHQEIRSPLMLHFIAEFFATDLQVTILRQRLLARLAADRLRAESGAGLRVEGDDLYLDDRKLSVSIAAPSPVSTMIHFGLNIETQGVPVPAVGLAELGVDPERFAERLGRDFIDELASLNWALSKVKGIP